MRTRDPGRTGEWRATGEADWNTDCHWGLTRRERIWRLRLPSIIILICLAGVFSSVRDFLGGGSLAGMVFISVTLFLSMSYVIVDLFKGMDEEDTEFYSGPPIKILIPAYMEPTGILIFPLWSSILQEKYSRDIVVLVDDPFHDMAESTKGVIKFIERVSDEIELIKRIVEIGDSDLKEYVVGYLKRTVERIEEKYPTHGLFCRKVFHDRVEHIQNLKDGEVQEYLLGLFDCTVSFFMRKKYSNLIQDRNKASNLNAYLGIMCHQTRESRDGQGGFLLEKGPGKTPPKYVAVLDADVFIHYDFVGRTVEILEANPQYAVCQSSPFPYPYTGNWVEKINHVNIFSDNYFKKKTTRLGVNFWCGNNGMIRFDCLERISYINKGHVKYIDDTTLVEDFDTSQKLVQKGFSVCTTQEDMAWVIYPGNYKDLIIQRFRWFDGKILGLRNLTGKGLYYRFLSCVDPSVLSFLIVAGLIFSPIVLKGYGCLSTVLFLLGCHILPVSPFMLLHKRATLSAQNYNSECWWLYSRETGIGGYGMMDVVLLGLYSFMLLPVYFLASMKSVFFFVFKRRKIFRRTPKDTEGEEGSPMLLFSNFFLFLVSSAVFVCFQTFLSFVVFSIYLMCLIIFFTRKNLMIGGSR